MPNTKVIRLPYAMWITENHGNLKGVFHGTCFHDFSSLPDALQSASRRYLSHEMLEVGTWSITLIDAATSIAAVSIASHLIDPLNVLAIPIRLDITAGA